MELKEYSKIVIEDKNITDVKELIGLEVPHCILVNSEDYGYGVFI